MKNFFLVFLIVGCVFSCNEEKKENKIKPTKEAEIEHINALSLNFEAVIENDGKFTLFFMEEGQEHISLKNSKAIDVKGGLDTQNLVFTIKEETIPTKLFLRFVNDERVQSISVKSATFSYGKKSFQIPDSLFFQYFMPNKFVDYNKENFTATTKEIDGDYLPRFFSRKVLIDKILMDL